MSWVCKYCSTSNEDSDKKCIVCDNDRSYGRERVLTRSAAEKLSLRGHVVIPDEYTAIGAEAFANRTDITSVTLHSNVTKIMREAFSCCINLTAVNCEGKLNSIGEKAFYNCRALSKSARPVASKVASTAFDADGFSSTSKPTKSAAATKPTSKPKPTTTSTRTTTPSRTSSSTRTTTPARTTASAKSSSSTRTTTSSKSTTPSRYTSKHYSPVVKKIARAVIVLFIIAAVVILIVSNMD